MKITAVTVEEEENCNQITRSSVSCNCSQVLSVPFQAIVTNILWWISWLGDRFSVASLTHVSTKKKIMQRSDLQTTFNKLSASWIVTASIVANS